MDQDVMRWVAEAQNGSQEAFGELVRRFQPRVYSLAFGMLNNAEDAKEIAQQAWIKAWQKLGTFRQDAQFFTWLYRIASNLCLDFRRKQARAREEPLNEAIEPDPAPELAPADSAVPRPDTDLQRQETRAQFERALAELSPEHRLVMTLREVEGQSYEEIAAMLGCRVGTVMSRLFYARKRLVARMRELQ